MEKPDWFKQHEIEDTKRFDAFDLRFDSADDMMADMRNSISRMEKVLSKAEPLIDAWQGAGVLGAVIRNIGGTVLAVGAIVTGIIWVINNAR